MTEWLLLTQTDGNAVLFNLNDIVSFHTHRGGFTVVAFRESGRWMNVAESVATIMDRMRAPVDAP